MIRMSVSEEFDRDHSEARGYSWMPYPKCLKCLHYVRKESLYNEQSCDHCIKFQKVCSSYVE